MTTLDQFGWAVLAGFVGGIIIVVLHLLLWKKHWRLQPPAAYIVGTATIGIVLSVWSALLGLIEPIIGFWVIAGFAGAMDVVAYWYRARYQAALDEASTQGFKRGQIVGLDDEAHDGEDVTG